MIFARGLLTTLAAAWLLAAAPAVADLSPAKPANPQYEAAEKAVKAGDFKRAIGLLEPMRKAQPKNADVLNMLGYSHRKLGELDKAMAYYTAALKEDPKHRGAHEYIGELYLMLGNLAKAEEHLAKLDDLCFFGCDEYTDLKNAIAAYKAKRKG
jgi:tetratricopeptide (TPR) repeat protein